MREMYHALKRFTKVFPGKLPPCFALCLLLLRRQSVIGFVDIGVRTTAHTFVLSSVHWDSQQASAGAASVRLGTVSLGGWLRRQLLDSPFHTLAG